MIDWAGIANVANDFTFGAANLGLNIADFVHRKDVDKENLKYQKDWLDYQKGLQQQIFGREDNAVQRRVADLKAAGLSPTLAAGSAAGAGQEVQSQAPQRNATRLNNIMAGVMARQSVAELHTTLQQARLIRQQVKESRAREENYEASAKEHTARANQTDIDNLTRGELNMNTLNNIIQQRAESIKRLEQIDAQIGYQRRAMSHYDDMRNEINKRIQYLEEQIDNAYRQGRIQEASYKRQEIDNLKEMRDLEHDLQTGLSSQRGDRVRQLIDLLRSGHETRTGTGTERDHYYQRALDSIMGRQR